MILHHTRIFAFSIISILTINISDARSWDLAVTVNQDVKFFLNNGTLIRTTTNRDAIAFSSISFDDTSHMMFLGDTKSKNASIFVGNLNSKEITMNALLKYTNESHIMGLVYDQPSRSLFWTDRKKLAIFKMYININMTSAEPEILLNLTNETPRGLSLDSCNRRLYWANSNLSNPSIMSSNVDGTNRTVIINEKLYQPVAVTVDHTTGKLYWLDDAEGIHYEIERSNLDGTSRETLVYGKHQQPIHIAVDREKIYWTDWVYSAIWSRKKDMTSKDLPQVWKSFNNSNGNAKPTGLLTRDNIGNVDCAIMKAVQKNNLLNEKEKIDNDRYNIMAISIKEDNCTSNLLKLCLNGGFLDGTSKVCQCKQGFAGRHCENSLCQNYCFHGECKMIADAQVNCICPPEYNGPRCETHVCSDYCFNGGECSIRRGEPFCTCKYSKGDRCEDVHDITDMCAMFCASQSQKLNETDINFCSCSRRNSSNQEYNVYCYDPRTKMLMVIFSIIIGVLTILIIILSYFINNLRRRPRIKKRFIVSKNGITPLTSRPQLPDDQCEIMIENCCNMNICETPCFEPKLRNSQSNMKKEEKNSLLENMDGNNSC